MSNTKTKKKKEEPIKSEFVKNIKANLEELATITAPEEGKEKCSVSLDQDVVNDLKKVATHPDIDRSFSYVLNTAAKEYRDKCKSQGLI